MARFISFSPFSPGGILAIPVHFHRLQFDIRLRMYLWHVDVVHLLASRPPHGNPKCLYGEGWPYHRNTSCTGLLGCLPRTRRRTSDAALQRLVGFIVNRCRCAKPCRNHSCVSLLTPHWRLPKDLRAIATPCPATLPIALMFLPTPSTRRGILTRLGTMQLMTVCCSIRLCNVNFY